MPGSGLDSERLSLRLAN